MARQKTTKEERERGIAQYAILCRMIDDGKWEYSRGEASRRPRSI